MTSAVPASVEVGKRRHFQLPAEDEAFLNSTDLQWETVTEGSARRLIIYELPIPSGYSHASADLFLRIEPLYPDTQLDMVYFHPAMQKSSGGTIGALSTEPFDNKQWQRWSRHRTAQNPWRPGIDCVETHLELVRWWLSREIP